MRKMFLVWGLLLASHPVVAQITIHILNPWLNDTCEGRKHVLRMYGNNESGYYPGAGMTAEGGGWFYFTYNTVDATFQIASECGPDVNNGRVQLGYSFNLPTMLATMPSGTIEIWIVPQADSTKKPEIYNYPPGGKVIYLLNPWPDNSPQIVFGNKPPMKMIAVAKICGWYRAYFLGPLDSLGNIKFRDYFHTKTYTSAGMTAGPGIDLRTSLATADTVYILPTPYPDGAPSQTATFPGRTGDCGYRKVSALFRDWAFDDTFANPATSNSSFYNNPLKQGSGHKNMVLPTLVADNNFKPRKNPDPNVNKGLLGRLETWFVTDTFPPGSSRRTNDTCIDLTLTKGDDGRWGYNSTLTNGFFPLDNFINPNNIKYWDRIQKWTDTTKVVPGARLRNFHFTMEMHMQFVYHKGAGLRFDFKGDDDLWVFVDNRLAIDLGGLNWLASASLLLDTMKGLEDGKTYPMDIFYAERNPVDANFIINTSLDLRSTNELYYKDTLLGPGRKRYDIWQRVSTQGLGCGQNLLLNDEDLAKVRFYIDGPSFPATRLLGPGVHFGGVIVDTSKSHITIDSSSIIGLLPGQYTVTFVSTVDSTRTGFLTFIVPALPPHHLDILTDKMTLLFRSDARIDSIVIDMADSAAQVYAVVRDSVGTFLSLASKAVWTSRNPAAATVAALPGDPSRCIITKKATGSSWIVVGDSTGKLKPDSVLVITYATPPFPRIRSAVMLDGNADLVPDTLCIALTDTFKEGGRLDSVLIAYRGKQYSFSGAAVTVRDSTVLVAVSSLSEIDGRPVGQVTLAMTTREGQKRDTKPFADGVCPALIAADVLENDGTQPDNLFLTFSEPVAASSVTGKQLLLIKSNTGDTVLLTINQLLNRVNDSIFTVQIAATDQKVIAGDRLRLLPGSKGGGIADLSKNRPHDNNRSVVVGFKLGAAVITAAWYLDANADGIIDNVAVRFKRKVAPGEIDSVKVVWKMRFYTANVVKAVALNDSTFTFPISAIADISTGGAMDVSVKFKAVPSVLRSSPAADSAAPVLVSARLLPGDLISGSLDRLPDSIALRFSEPVPNPGTRPLRLSSKKSGIRYQFTVSTLSQQNDSCKFLIESIVPAGSVDFGEAGDTVWLDTAARVSDSYGTPQLNPQNRRVLLAVAWPKPRWEISISASPFIPGSTPIPAEYGIMGVRYGTVIIAQPRTPIDASQISGTATVYDALGNTVAYLIPQVGKGRFYFAWNGTNRSSRIVGTGTYLCIVRLSGSSQAMVTETRFIGVKR